MSYRRVFLTFGDSRLRYARERITGQARAIGVYDEIVALDEGDLDKAFVAGFRDRLQLGSLGFGYYCWKPQVVLQCLDNMRDGDILNYCDIGCHIVPEGRARLLEFFEMTDRSPSGMLGFYTPADSASDAHLTKGDILDYFGVRDDAAITNTGQIIATVFFVKKNPGTVAIIRQWLGAFEHDFSLADDTPSRSPNLPGFVRNIYDQSIFSILRKLNPVSLLAIDAIEPVPCGESIEGLRLDNYPILIRRDWRNPADNMRHGKFVSTLIRLACGLIPSKRYRKKMRNRLLHYWYEPVE